jgi:hypothetical protein
MSPVVRIRSHENVGYVNRGNDQQINLAPDAAGIDASAGRNACVRDAAGICCCSVDTVNRLVAGNQHSDRQEIRRVGMESVGDVDGERRFAAFMRPTC